MALTDTGQSDEDIEAGAERRQQRDAPSPSGVMPDPYRPTLPESISPLSPAGQLTRIAQANTGSVIDFEDSAGGAGAASAPGTTNGGLPNPSAPSWLDSIMDTPWSKKGEWTQAQEQAANAKIDTEQRKVKDKASNVIHADSDRKLMAMPQPQSAARLPISPIGDFRNNLKSFATPLMILGAVASVGGRRRALNSMNALGGLFKGMAASNAELARLQYQKFHGSVNGLIAETESHNMQYNEIFNDPDRSDANKLADAHALAAGLEDKTMMGYTSKGDLAGAQSLVQGREKTNEHLMTLRSRASSSKKSGGGGDVEVSDEEAKALYEGREKYPSGKLGRALFKQVQDLYPDASMGAFDKRKAGETVTAREEAKQEAGEKSVNPETVNAVVKEMKKGNLDALRTAAGWGAQGRPFREAAWAEYARQSKESGDDKGFTEAQTQLKAERAAATAAATAPVKATGAALTQMEKQKAGIDSFSKFMIGNFKVLLDLAKKVDTTGVPAMESWIRAGRQATGDPDVAAFHFQWQATMTEVARVLQNPNITGVLPVSVRQEISEALPFAANLQQLQRIYDLANGDTQRRKQAIDEEIGRLRGELNAGGGGQLQDQSPDAARDWARKNPNDPRAKDILKALGE